MKIKLIALFFSFVNCVCLGQEKIDLTNIKNAVRDSSSVYFYNKLADEFNQNPADFSLEKGKYLYYGKFYRLPVIKGTFALYMDVLEAQTKRDFKTAIDKGEEMLKTDPANLEIISILIYSYQKTDQKSLRIPNLKIQQKLLLDCIINGNTGELETDPFIVTSVGDEYLIFDALGKNLRSYKRSSRIGKDSVLDVFTRSNKTFYVKVLYNTELFKENSELTN